MTQIYTPETMDLIRKLWIDTVFTKWMHGVFRLNPQAQSGTLLVASYWNDEADDAVHNEVLFYDTPEAPIGAYSHWWVKYPEEVPASYVQTWKEAGRPTPLLIDRWPTDKPWGNGLGWHGNGAAIALFQAFCKEGGSQNQEMHENYDTLLRFNRRGDVEVVGTKHRPWLDGHAESWFEDGHFNEPYSLAGMGCESFLFGEPLAEEMAKHEIPVQPLPLHREANDNGVVQQFYTEGWIAQALPFFPLADIGRAVKDSELRETIIKRVDAWLRIGGAEAAQ